MSTSPSGPVNLPREVLRWIQSLDLAYSVKNVKRDFANGFLVAEIVSRYYAKEIQMHSYDNAISAKAKKDNWAQLAKVFRKVGLPDVLSENEMHLIASVEEGAAAAFICKLYEVLTRRVVQTQVKKPMVGREPGYTREISVNKVRKALNRNDLNDESDIQTVSRLAASVVEEHERSLQEDRIVDPVRFANSSAIQNGSSVLMQSAPKASSEVDVVMPQVKVKEIQVKQLDRNVTHLRALKQIQSTHHRGSVGGDNNRAVTPSGNEYGGYNNRADSPTTPQQFGYDSHAAKSPKGGMLPDNSLSFINTCLARIMAPNSHPAWSPHADPYTNFLGALDFFRSEEKGEIDGLVSDCLMEIGNSAQMLAEACTVAPKQYWKVSDLFCAVLIAAPLSSASFSGAITSFEMIGRWIVDRDPASSLAMFADFTLVRLTELLATNPPKRLGVMRLLHAFAPCDTPSHVQCIKRLQQALPDLSVFINCLTILATIETVEMDEMLLDLYVYYATIGLGMPSPRLRANAVAMLASFVHLAERLIVPMLPQFARLAQTEGWWEIQLHLWSLCGALLEVQQIKLEGSEISELPADRRQVCDSVTNIMETMLSRKLCYNVLKWAAVSMAFGTFQGPAYVGMFLDVLQQLTPDDLRFLLNASSDRPMPWNRLDNASSSSLPTASFLSLTASSGAQFQVVPVTVRWNALSVLEFVVRQARAAASEQSAKPAAAQNSQHQDRLTAFQMQVVLATVSSAVDNARRGGDKLDNIFEGRWLQCFQDIRNHVLVGLCDPECAPHATAILSTMMFYSTVREKILQDPKFTAALRLLYPASADKSTMAALTPCQTEMESFLRICFSAGHPFNSTVHSVLTQFSNNYPSQFEKATNLKRLAKEFASQLK